MLKKVILLIMVCLLLCGCSRNTAEEITFSSWGSVTEVGILKKVISDFESENPDIKVKFIHIPQNYFQKIHLLFASNTAPDVIFINNLYLPVYESKLEDLSGLIDKEEFYPQSLDGMSYGGKLLAVPRDVSNFVFYVNLDKMKIPPDGWKRDDFLNIIRNQNGLVVSFEEDIYWALPYLMSFGGGVLDENLNRIIDSPQSLAGIEFYLDLRDKYKVAPSKSQVGSSTLAQMFLDKKIAMYLSGRWMYPKIKETADFNWAVAPFFGPVPCDVSGWAVSKDSKHKESAKKLVKYLSDEKSIEYFTQTGLIVPARIKAAKLLDDEHNGGVFTEVIKTSVKTPVNKDYKKLMDKINSQIF